jgi:hypothetical protein
LQSLTIETNSIVQKKTIRILVGSSEQGHHEDEVLTTSTHWGQAPNRSFPPALQLGQAIFIEFSA